MDVNVVYVNMPARIKAFTMSYPDCIYTVVINSKLAQEQAYEAYLHELSHIADGDCECTESADVVEKIAHN